MLSISVPNDDIAHSLTSQHSTSFNSKLSEIGSETTSDFSENAFYPPFLGPEEEERLTRNILALYEILTPTPEASERRNKVLEKVQNLINQEYSNQVIKAYLFGSSENTLGTFSSDVDICLLTDWNEFNVQALAALLEKSGFTNIVCIPEAKVPIVKAWDPFLLMSCDFNINNPIAIDNTALLKTYASIDPRVRPLTIAIKFWTKQRLLNDAASGGTLSTYAWVNIIFNFLQTRSPPILPVLHSYDVPPKYRLGLNIAFYKDEESLKGFGSANKETLGGLLFSFFKRFAFEFDYRESVLSLRTGSILSKVDKGWDKARGNHFFCIEEPFNVTRNIGNSADEVSVKGIIGEFQRACHLFAENANLAEVCAPYPDGISWDRNFDALKEKDVLDLRERLSRLEICKPSPASPRSIPSKSSISRSRNKISGDSIKHVHDISSFIQGKKYQGKSRPSKSINNYPKPLATDFPQLPSAKAPAENLYNNLGTKDTYLSKLKATSPLIIGLHTPHSTLSPENLS